ncbi:hypothetical protein CONPUDRAFT_164312 [Coniophora puteana RWD-64-598 SS2]|uniref:Fungal-type protein kinase domain-containing protein n=1 Tax=Coniophora puteana (strain RWD-64-598) TaxID=741705 RepID=A0A5M3MWA7_CONPW|nr:uncharacterized protein CONPUDRAFT_164312 [Coniophora puteana RWD-64-598 SS2]EIW83350.1 hypothetical protein CONPUDRAFT_164312 [Coniophora puteana RWD-64-598 SS2]
MADNLLDLASANSETPRSNPGLQEGYHAETRRLKVAQVMANYLMTCSPEAWFKQYAPHSRWSDSELDELLHALKEKNIWKPEGWTEILAAMQDRQTENNTYSPISKIAAAVAEQTQKMKGIAPTTKIQNAPHDWSVPEVPSHKWFPDLRGYLAKSQTIDPRTRESDSTNPQTFANDSSDMYPLVEGELQEPQRVELRKPRPSARLDGNSKGAKEQETKMNLSDVVAIGEFKREKKTADQRDNELKISGGATELLYNDPCRRFVNGFTIEDRNMRMWRFERSHVCFSQPFDFHKKAKLFLRFLLYIIFSSPKDLGFDPTVRRYYKPITENADSPSPETDGCRYEIAYRYQIGSRFFLTEGPPISEEAAYWVASRATRVWRVREMIFQDRNKEHIYTLGECKVLKDAYLFEDAVLESVIRGQIMESLKHVDGVDLEDAARHFLDYELDEVVKLPDGDKEWREDDLTSVTDANARAYYSSAPNPPQPSLVQESQRTSMSQKDSNQPGTTDASQQLPDGQSGRSKSHWDDLRYHRRKHVRTVIAEVCQNMYELDNWVTFLECMIHLIKGLNYMRQAGWVHRDISGGNCLWHPGTTQGKLADLEYARPYKHNSMLIHDPKTGTPAFMAVEYQERRYMFRPRQNFRTVLDDDDVFLSQPHIWNLPFAYNFYHDLESILWLYVWMAHYRPPSPCVPPALVTSVSLTLRTEGNYFFVCGTGGNQKRSGGISDGRLLSRDVGRVYAGARSAYMLKVFSFVHPLGSAYTALQSSLPDDTLPSGNPIWMDTHFGSALYDEFCDHVTEVLEKVKQHPDIHRMVSISSRWEKTGRPLTITQESDSSSAHANKKARLSTDQ